MNKEQTKEAVFIALGEASALFMSNPQKGTEQIMPEKELSRIGNELAGKFSKSSDALVDALIWCSGSDDFQIEGKARAGWEKLCQPLLKENNT